MLYLFNLYQWRNYSPVKHLSCLWCSFLSYIYFLTIFWKGFVKLFDWVLYTSLALREKCPYSKLSGQSFSSFELNIDQRNSEYTFHRVWYTINLLTFSIIHVILEVLINIIIDNIFCLFFMKNILTFTFLTLNAFSLLSSILKTIKMNCR